jgi:hypothetical protein
MTRESMIEAHLVRRVHEAGGECLKFTSPGRRGVPDRLVLLPGGRAIFVEVKAPGRYPTPAQRRAHNALRYKGFRVLVVNSFEDVHWLLMEVN